MRRAPLLCLLALACSDGPDDTDPAADTDPLDHVDRYDPDAGTRPNPLAGDPDAPLLPWPSDQFLAPAPGSATGLRVHVDEDLLPDGLDAAQLATQDGFSRVVPIVAWLPGGFAPASLPDPTDWGATTSPTSPVLLVREGTFELVPALVERDATAADPEQAPLLIRPHRALAPETRYAVLLRTALQRADGAAHVPTEAVAALLADAPSDDPAIEAWRPLFELVRDAADAHDVPHDEIALAWTFRTRSEEQVIGPAVAMQDQAMDAAVAYTVDPPVYEEDRALVEGTFTVPWFLDDDRRLVLDDAGVPAVQGTRDVPFLVTIPRTVTEPRTGLLVGHGFFSSLEEPTWSNMFRGLEQWQAPAVSANFHGFSEPDFAVTAGILVGRLADLDTVVHQQLQSHVNFTVLWRVVVEELSGELEIAWDEGAPFHPLAGDRMNYIGASNGGTQGLVMMTTSPVLDRGALVVPGGGWSHMLQRAAQWSTLGSAIAKRYGDPRELQVVMSLLQQTFDPVDSLNFVDHLVHDRLEGRHPSPDILLVEAVNDAQVSNLVTRWVVGNAGVPQLVPSVADVWGVETVEAGTEGVRVAYEAYDLGVPPVPVGNLPAKENGVHDEVRRLQAYRDQVEHFLATGEIVRTCDGPCDPE